MLVVHRQDLADQVERAGGDDDVVDVGHPGQRVTDDVEITVGVDADQGLALEAGLQRVGDRDDLHDAGVEQLLHPLAHGRLGQAHRLADGRVGAPAIELADRLAQHAPGDLNKVFFTTGGGEAVETAWKLAKQYFKLVGKPMKHKVISRAVAYHGTPQGALSITGIPEAKQMFEPLVPGGIKVPNTNFYRAPEHGDDLADFGRWAADQIEMAIQMEGPETVACVFLEPVQNSGGCFPPPPGYFQRVREICDRYDVLLVSDEVICAFGRLGTMFACDKFGYVPDMITCAKGLTSGYSPIGAMIASERLFEPFKHETTYFPHGYTFGGHPVSTAVAMANLDVFEREGLPQRVLDHEDAFRSTLEQLLDLPIVGDVRGNGYFYGIELVKDKATKETFDDDESERLLRGFLSRALFEAGLYCRADDRGDPVVQLAPPLISGPAEFEEMERVLRSVLTEAWARL